jgi:arylsulfatase A-like enzyme
MNPCRTLLAVLALSAFAHAATAPRPNILLIIADDLGYGDLGCYGQQEIKTPNIDRMAAEGTRFTQVYAGCTVCAPSRCALMTGFHTGHARVRGNKRNEEILQPGDFTISEMFKKSGYTTAMFGKWGIGGLGYPGYPTRKGWDEWFGFFSQMHAHTYYPEHLLNGEHEQLVQGNWGAVKKGYAPDLFLDRALKFIDKNQSNPFLLYFASTIPHANNELGRDTGDGIEIPEDAPYSAKPWPKLERKFAATITRLDRDIGRILEKLKTLGLDDNTLVLFSSDNGARPLHRPLARQSPGSQDERPSLRLLGHDAHASRRHRGQSPARDRRHQHVPGPARPARQDPRISLLGIPRRRLLPSPPRRRLEAHQVQRQDDAL